MLQITNNIKVLFFSTVGLMFMVSLTPTPPPKQAPIRETIPINPKDPPCIQMYNCIEYYADSFNIPKRYAYGIAQVETGYNGPFHWRYNPAQTSYAGALGPMQYH